MGHRTSAAQSGSGGVNRDHQGYMYMQMHMHMHMHT